MSAAVMQPVEVISPMPDPARRSFLGYQTEARYYPAQKFALAFQFNSSAQGALGRSPAAVVGEIARRLIEAR